MLVRNPYNTQKHKSNSQLMSFTNIKMPSANRDYTDTFLIALQNYRKVHSQLRLPEIKKNFDIHVTPPTPKTAIKQIVTIMPLPPKKKADNLKICDISTQKFDNQKNFDIRTWK